MIFSDEENEKDQLLFLTITPEFDDVDENASNAQQQVRNMFTNFIFEYRYLMCQSL